MLPGGSELEFTRTSKRNDTTAEIPVIMSAKAAEDSNVIRGLDVGDDYVTKPFAPSRIDCAYKGAAAAAVAAGGEQRDRLECRGSSARHG